LPTGNCRSWRCFDRALDAFIQQQMLAA